MDQTDAVEINPMNGPHIFPAGEYVLRLSDGMIARVLRADHLRAVVRTLETFSERLEIDQGDPGWFYGY